MGSWQHAPLSWTKHFILVRLFQLHFTIIPLTSITSNQVTVCCQVSPTWLLGTPILPFVDCHYPPCSPITFPCYQSSQALASPIAALYIDHIVSLVLSRLDVSLNLKWLWRRTFLSPSSIHFLDCLSARLTEVSQSIYNPPFWILNNL